MTTAAQLLIDTLVDDWGVRHVFGLPGDGINGIMEALRQRRDDVQFVQVRHEEAAAFAACAYAKFTGGLGVCLATSGPGAIHLLNGLYDAKMDGQPVLALTGQTYHDLIGTFYQQEVNLLQLFSDVAVYNHEVRAPAQVTALVHDVLHVGRPHDPLVVQGHVHEELVEVDVLLIVRADEVVKGVAGDGEHRLAIELGVVESVE